MRLRVLRRVQRTAAVLAASAAVAACAPAGTGASIGSGTGAGPGAGPSAGPGPQGQPAALDQQPRPEVSELIDAAGRGDAGGVRDLLARGARLDARDPRGRTALVAAAYGNSLDAAQVLVEAGADVNAKDTTQQSAYLIATSEVGDDPRLLELTLGAGADVQAKDSYNGTGLIRAAERGHPRIVARLLRAGVQVDHVNRLGWTALLEAIVLGEGGARHVETVRLLLAGGANPDLPDRDGVSPLAHAQRRGQEAVVRLLREAGART